MIPPPPIRLQTAPVLLSELPISPTLVFMEVYFTPEQEAQLAEIAAHTGSSAEIFVHDAALRLLEEDRRYLEAIQKGEDALDRGEFLTHQAVGERLGLLLKR